MFCSRCGKLNDDLARFCQSCGANLGAMSREPDGQERIVSSGSLLEYAGFWRRLLAAIADGIVIAVAYSIIGLVWLPHFARPQARIAGVNLAILVAWIYFALMESSSTRATLGKMALGICVTDLKGDRVSFSRATGRHFAKIISTIIVFVGYVMAGFTQRKQALHDIIAGCLVVKKASLQSRETISSAP
jgi:uncharacterized RDD family membrane protein YckC